MDDVFILFSGKPFAASQWGVWYVKKIDGSGIDGESQKGGSRVYYILTAPDCRTGQARRFCQVIQTHPVSLARTANRGEE